jgi:hypothetical protein
MAELRASLVRMLLLLLLLLLLLSPPALRLYLCVFFAGI